MGIILLYGLKIEYSCYTIILFLNDKIISFINKFILSKKYNIIA